MKDNLDLKTVMMTDRRKEECGGVKAHRPLLVTAGTAAILRRRGLQCGA